MDAATLDISEARKQLHSFEKRLDSENLIYITRHGKKAFAVINLEYLQTVLETIDILSDPDALQMLQKSLDDIREGRVYDHDDVVEEFR